jgi:SAM-dependent methyltransferase
VSRTSGRSRPSAGKIGRIRDDQFDRWIASLEARHLADLTFAEVSRALRALSSAYVERRDRLAEGAALAGAGKRAAFALFYGPMHYLLVRDIVRELSPSAPSRATIVDLGCGTGAAGAAWATAIDGPPELVGIDRHPWAVAEAKWTYSHFALNARVERRDVASAVLPRHPAAIVAAFTINEVRDDAGRDALLKKLVDRAAHGDRVLVVEPLAGFVAPWWGRWRDVVLRAGGRADEWRFRIELPAIVRKLDRAAGLDHRELTARSLSLG